MIDPLSFEYSHIRACHIRLLQKYIKLSPHKKNHTGNHIHGLYKKNQAPPHKRVDIATKTY